MKRQADQKGLTLVELLSVVAVIAILIAIAYPPFLRSRVNANEAVARHTLKSIHTAMTAYRVVNPTYPENLMQLAASEENGPAYMDEALLGGAKSGYTFQIASSNAYSYEVVAMPEESGLTGSSIFLMNEAGLIQDIAGVASTTTSGIGSNNRRLPINAVINGIE